MDRRASRLESVIVSSCVSGGGFLGQPSSRFASGDSTARQTQTRNPSQTSLARVRRRGSSPPPPAGARRDFFSRESRLASANVFFSEGRAGSRRGGRRRVSGPERPRLGVAPPGPAADSAGSVTVRGHRADSPRAPDITSGREGRKNKKKRSREHSGPGRLGRRRRSSVAPGKNPSRPHARLHARTPLS